MIKMVLRLLLLLFSNLMSGQLLISQIQIVPENGYNWPAKERDYWPTAEWQISPLEQHNISPAKITIADKLAESDKKLRSLIIVKDGYIVFEKYYREGGIDKSTEVWSVTKSFVSALIGITIDKGFINSHEDLMKNYLPEYSFDQISLYNVLTHTTGLNWDEGNQQSWIQSKDWTKEALERGYYAKPGEKLLYSSANSHFLSQLINKTTGKTPGEFADEHLFSPLGIKFKPSGHDGKYTHWQELHYPIPYSWRKDNKGIEIGAFGLHLTAREMAKFGFLYLNKGIWDGKIIVSENWVEKSTRDHIHRSSNFGFGFQWVVTKRHNQICFEADGWGGQMISIIPSLDMIVVIKCDEINPGENESYNILNAVIEAAF